MFQLPSSWLQTKRHLVRVDNFSFKTQIDFYFFIFNLIKKYDTLLAPNTSQYVHHWLFYECTLSYDQIFNGTKPSPGLCFANPWFNYRNYCQKISLGILI